MVDIVACYIFIANQQGLFFYRLTVKAELSMLIPWEYIL
nr:MAG TPA: hypothetical protein [Caudoviricetes sp.]